MAPNIMKNATFHHLERSGTSGISLLKLNESGSLCHHLSSLSRRFRTPKLD